MGGKNAVRVLIVDDSPGVVKRLSDELKKKGGYEVKSPSGAGDALVKSTKELAPVFRPHVVVLDLCLIPGSSDDYLGIPTV